MVGARVPAVTPPLVLTGRVVTFDPARPVIDRGAVYIGEDERIAAVQGARERAPAGFDGAPRLSTGGTIYPGLMDLHNHMVYNALSLWSPPGRSQPYTSRYQWPSHGSYEGLISDPANALGALAGKALLKYVETKAVVGGVTAIQGSAKMAHPYEGWLVRNVEAETFQTGKKTVFQSALPLRTPADYKHNAERMRAGNAFIYHLCEGTEPGLVGEYDTMRDADCLQPTLSAIHCTALQRANFDEWSPHGGSVVWSPFSNLWLYRATTDVVAARDAGVRVCLGADWSPSGSKHLLGELKVADLWNRTGFHGALSAQEICEMATCNPADALGWGDRLGRLRVGLHGDVLVTANRDEDPYRNLIVSRERDVLFVAINGQPFYGTTALMKAAGATRAEPIRVGSLRRSIVLEYPGIKDADMGWGEVLADLELAVKDPVKRYLRSRSSTRRASHRRGFRPTSRGTIRR
ncbi:MAG: 5-methylthioadenosine/S-adenosylhomocysteine deaminase [Thermoleophilaceae bacterium]|nr:5-methylthioadenosine/S-adenosylhomocysteine deaminase [Thermoleophilaceae bacterium]